MRAFIHISKTGGTTLLTMLRSTFGLAHCDIEPWEGKRKDAFDAYDYKLLRRVYPWLYSILGHHIRPYSNLDDDLAVQYYVMLRDPVKRCISEYQYQTTQRGKTWSFDQYIHGHSGSNQQVKYLCGEANAAKAIDMIEKKGIVCGLLERYDESLLIFNRLVFDGKLNVGYQRQKIATDNQMGSKIFNSEQMLTAIRECNQEDQKLYDYVRSVVFPRQAELYGSALSNDLSNYRSQQKSDGFNDVNIFINRLYRNVAYKPALAMYRLLR